jgi:peptide/nickel transport system permease protein
MDVEGLDGALAAAPAASRSAFRARLEEAHNQFRILTRNRLNAIALSIIGVVVVTAILAPYIAPHPDAIVGTSHLEIKLQPPSLSYPFGTDEFGRCIFSRVLYGARISLVASITSVGLALLIGVPLGVLAAGFGKFLDDFIMRIVDVFLSFPFILLAILIAAILGPSLRNAIIAIAISWWPWYTRLIRGQAVAIRERQFVRAAQANGTPRRKIIFKHILPNALGPTIVQASLDFGFVVMALAALSFLGLGAQPPTPEWGLMINQSRTFFMNAWWYMVFPGMAIILTCLCFNILGDGIREMLDPKSRNF